MYNTMIDTAINHANILLMIQQYITLQYPLIQQSITLLYCYCHSSLIRSILLLPQQPNTFYTPIDTAIQHVTTPLSTQQPIMLLHYY
jgi:hypothetical protein